jgi:hypothetical protein
MELSVTIEASVCAAAEVTQRVCEVAGMFGLGLDGSRRVLVVPRSTLMLRPGRIVLVTGPSGSGKSTILRLVKAEVWRARGDVKVIDVGDESGAGDRPVVDACGEPLEAWLACLSRAGLADAFVLLRRESELSDGQRCRLALARAMMAAEEGGRAVILADEFLATLDRVTAKAVARSVRRWVSRTRDTFVAATTHDDLLEALQPDVLVWKDMGSRIDVVELNAERR